MDGHDCLSGRSPATMIVCVTGGTGYIASWLIRMLLHKGYVVHTTVRNTGKASWLLSTFKGYEGQLKIFKADLSNEGSFDEAVTNCKFVFHVAAFMELSPSVDQNVEEYVQAKILEPAIRGTKNILQACAKAGSVERVIFTSSVSTITAKDGKGGWNSIVNESSIVQIDEVWRTKPKGWIYVLAKLVTEEMAFKFAKDNGIDLVSVISPTIAGPFLTPQVPASVRVLLSPLSGDPELYPILRAVHSRLGSIPLAHVEDICNAHMFLTEQPSAKGRYICAVGSYQMTELTDLLCQSFPNFKFDKANWSNCESPPVISSKRLTDLGFKFKYDVNDIIQESVKSCISFGFLDEKEVVSSLKGGLNLD